MANGNGNNASTGQQLVGKAGPFGALISGVSQLGTSQLDKSDSKVAGAISSGVFDPASNLEALGDSDFSTGEKALSLLTPFAFGAIKKGKERGIQAQDPIELQRLAAIDRIRKSIGAGTDPLTQQAISRAQQTGASTQQRLARATGGSVGATIAALTRAQRGTQAATNQAIAGAQQRLPFFENLGQQLGTRISQRSLEIGLLNRAQSLAENAQAAKERAANIGGAVSVFSNARNAQGVTNFQTPQGFDSGFSGGKAGIQDGSVGFDASQPPSLNTDFGVGNNFIQQVPVVSPGAQSSVGSGLPADNQAVLDQLSGVIRNNPSGAPSGAQLGLMNQLNQ